MTGKRVSTEPVDDAEILDVLEAFIPAAKALAGFYVGSTEGGSGPLPSELVKMRAALNAIVPDIVEACAKVADEVGTVGADIAAERIRALVGGKL